MSRPEEPERPRLAPGVARWVVPPPEVRMSLLQHLGELRGRLLRVVVAVLLFSVVGMVFARPLFGWLMRPVLAALPSDARSLIYTSGIEEVNVLLKVGLYAGLMLSTPIFLWQTWSFVSPGLLPEERRYASPFVAGGTLAFVTGAAFCYFAILPQMFSWLLAHSEAPELKAAVTLSQASEADALRYIRLGELGRAEETAKRSVESLGPSGSGPPTSVEVTRRLEFLGQLVDALQIGFGDAARPVLVQVVERRQEALQAGELGHWDAAAQLADAAAAKLAVIRGAGAGSDGAGALWRLAKARIQGQTRLDADDWTRPMLSMSEQLSLVLVLEVAMGLIFELPLVMALLTGLGVLRSAFLIKYQRHALVVGLVVAAVVTPTGDVINLVLMAAPLTLCYELGTLASWLIERRRQRAERPAMQAS